MQRPIVAALAAFVVAGAQETPGAQSNVLIVLADDIGTDMLDFYAEPGATDFPTTPFLTSLAADGVTFLDAWSNPTCSPTRASILTGHHAVRTGIGRPIQKQGQVNIALPSTTTIPEILAGQTATSYTSGAFGKWHLTGDQNACDHPLQRGFDHFEGTVFDAPKFYDWSETRCPDTMVNCPTPMPVCGSGAGNYLVSEQIDSASAWMQGAAEPWFCYLAVQAPYEFVNKANYPPESLPLPGNTTKTTGRETYKALIEAMDVELMNLSNDLAVPQSTLGPGSVLDNTVIIFVGDNGTPTTVIESSYASLHPSDPDGKGSMYERGINVPLIVGGGPVFFKNFKVPVLMHVVDVFPTALGFLGATGVPLRDGWDLHPILAGIAPVPLRPYTYSERFDNQSPPCSGPMSTYSNVDRTVRDQAGFKLIRRGTPPMATYELYDLSTDWMEMNDLSASNPTKLAELELVMDIIAGGC